MSQGVLLLLFFFVLNWHNLVQFLQVRPLEQDHIFSARASVLLKLWLKIAFEGWEAGPEKFNRLTFVEINLVIHHRWHAHVALPFNTSYTRLFLGTVYIIFL